jgi:hypothetical protein
VNLLSGLSLVDAVGRLILASIVLTLVLGAAVNLLVRARYARLERDLDENAASRRFWTPALNAVVDDARRAAESGQPNTQAIIEERFQTGLPALLLGERFVRAATGLVIILGLLGTFYGLTSSIGKLVQLVGGNDGVAVDVGQAVTSGLTQALSGMAVAFSNSLLGVFSAVVLTVLGVVSNLADRRTALMLKIETYLDRVLPGSGGTAAFDASVTRLDAVVTRFEASLAAFSARREFSEFLKDNVQRMSLSFADLNDALKAQVGAVRRGYGS